MHMKTKSPKVNKVVIEVTVDEFIGRKVKQERIKQGMKGQELAAKLDRISPQYLSFLERGTRPWKIINLAKVAEALKKPITYFTP